MRTLVLRCVAVLAGLIVTLLLFLVLAYAYLSTRTNGELTSLNENRSYLLYVPDSYDPTTPTPLVISLHGAFLYPRFQMRLTKWNELADQEGFIVVYPKAAGVPGQWRMMAGDELSTEVRFFSDLIDDLSMTYNIDPDRIYANGFSNGAAMTNMLACNLPDRIAAFGMVATPVTPWEWCEDSRPAPIIAIHGAKDPFSLYEGGENFLTTEPLPSIHDWISWWAERNRCNSGPVYSEPRETVEVMQYSDCSQGASVMLYSLMEAGHIWPGGMRFPGNSAGPNSDRIDGTRVMWSFFQNHPLTR